jgi:hypothetical protein
MVLTASNDTKEYPASDSKKLIGIIVGSVVGFIIVVALLVFCYNRYCKVTFTYSVEYSDGEESKTRSLDFFPNGLSVITGLNPMTDIDCSLTAIMELNFDEDGI